MSILKNPDSKLYSLLNKFVLVMELNVWVLLCCLPVVTVGAALCSMHSVLLKIYREEEKYVTGDFFRAMKSNLKNGTILWLMLLGGLASLVAVYALAVRLIPGNAVYVIFVLLIAAVLGLVYMDWAFILQSRYVYTPGQCLKNALLAWIKYPGSTFVYLVSLALPFCFCLSLKLLPLILILGIALPHMLSTTLYSRVFDEMEGIPPRAPKI